MKNNKWTRAAGGLLVLTLATSCFVGGTFAKYVTEDEATDTARVAKWGVTVEVTGDGFKTSYGKDDVYSNVSDDTVISSVTEEKVIAPGTDGEFGGIRITGTPEVAVDVKTTAVVDLGTEADWTVNGRFYCPLVFNIGGHIIEGLDYGKSGSGGLNSLVSDIKKAIEATTTKEYEANTDLATVGQWETYDTSHNYGPENEHEGRDKTLFADYDEDGYVDFMWAWPFEKGEGGNTTVTWYGSGASAITSTLDGDYDDELDTKLANKFDGGKAPEISIEIKTSVTQVD